MKLFSNAQNFWQLCATFFSWRLALVVPLVLALFFVPFRANSEFTSITQNRPGEALHESNLLSVWANFDGVHYLAIASRGYQDEGRFLPLFPALIAVCATPLTLFKTTVVAQFPEFWSGLFVSTLSTFLALYFLRKLLLIDYPKSVANKTLLLLLASPTAFFFAGIYTEGLFLLISVLSFYFARRKMWWASILCIALASITRLSGILLLIPIFFEFYSQKTGELNAQSLQLLPLVQKFIQKNLTTLLLFALSPVLLIFYSYYNFVTWGDPLFFVNAHAQLGNSREVSGLVFPLITVYRYLKIFLTVPMNVYEFWVALLEFGALVLSVVSLVLAYKAKIRTSYQLFALVMIALPVFSGTLSGFPRYILPIFPFFLALSIWFEAYIKTSVNQKKAKIIFSLFIALSFLLQGLLFALFAHGYYIS